ncbi:hypothetical protein D9M71_454470 [compost metagenome]
MRKPKCGRSGSGSCSRRFTVHSTSPVATISVPATPDRKNSQRMAVGAKRAACMPIMPSRV